MYYVYYILTACTSCIVGVGSSLYYDYYYYTVSVDVLYVYYNEYMRKRRKQIGLKIFNILKYSLLYVHMCTHHVVVGR